VSRAVLRLVLDVVLTVAIALGILGLWQWFLGGSPGDGFAEGARVLFNFMDVGLAIWLVLLIVSTVRGGVTAGRAYLLLLAGVVVNLVVVIVVGFVQGGWAPLLVLFAIEAGIASLIAAAIVLPLVHRRAR
jgi:hypothetical protein